VSITYLFKLYISAISGAVAPIIAFGFAFPFAEILTLVIYALFFLLLLG
jgi:hypothetical protein